MASVVVCHKQMTERPVVGSTTPEGRCVTQVMRRLVVSPAVLGKSPLREARAAPGNPLREVASPPREARAAPGNPLREVASPLREALSDRDLFFGGQAAVTRPLQPRLRAFRYSDG